LAVTRVNQPRLDETEFLFMHPQTFILPPRMWVPNNDTLPALLYRAAMPQGTHDVASALEAMFRENGWPPHWRDIVWRYHHYHPNAHETLGVSAGRATLVVGGPGGPTISVEPGDVLVLPAGTGHCCVENSDDFEVVGAYPPGQAAFETCTGLPSTAQVAQLKALAPYATDPVTGKPRS
jgi:uncharacterized protein YjlB